MENRKCFVIRTSDEEKEWIWKEIQKGQLRQGWGISGIQLKEVRGNVDKDKWINRYKENALRYWNYNATDQEAEKRYKILSKMLKLNKGDIIVVPKMPSYDSFIILSVKKEYEFDFESKQNRDNYEDFRHVINIDTTNIKVFNYYSSTDSVLIHKKMRAYQSAVNNVWNEEFIEAVEELVKKEGDTRSKNINDLFKNIKLDSIKKTWEGIKKLSPRDLEKLVEQTFINAGYKVLSRNKYDREGGDSDLVLTKSLPLISDCVDLDYKIYIQIKHKNDIDNDDIDGVEQLIKITDTEEGDHMKILISTAKKFTEQCKIKANGNNVVLIDGFKLVDMITKYI